MALTMACPNFKKSLKMAFDPLGVKIKFCSLPHQIPELTYMHLLYLCQDTVHVWGLGSVL
jgi:hypothetical protein